MPRNSKKRSLSSMDVDNDAPLKKSPAKKRKVEQGAKTVAVEVTQKESKPTQPEKRQPGRTSEDQEEFIAPIVNIIWEYRKQLVLLYRSKRDWNEFGKVAKRFEGRVKKAKPAKGNNRYLNQLSKDLKTALDKFHADISKLSQSKAQDRDQIVARCDMIRDDTLEEMDIRIIDDRQRNRHFWMLMTKGWCAQGRAKRIERDIRKWEKIAKAKPKTYFKNMKSTDGKPMYSQFDKTGRPTHDAKGNELSKKKEAMLQRQYERMERMFKAYETNLKLNANFLEDLRSKQKQALQQVR